MHTPHMNAECNHERRGRFGPLRPHHRGGERARRMGREGPFGPSDGHDHRSEHPHRGGPGGRGGRARRGDVRSAILALLTERPMNGYEMMGELESRSGGAWRPSPGALYPALQALEDEALIAAQTSDGKRQFELTDAGREVSTAGDAQRPWEQFAANVPPANKLLRDRVGQIVLAVRQVAEVATEEQKAEATQILTDARKALYQLLADSE